MEIRETADLEHVDALILPGGESTSIGGTVAASPGNMLERLRDRIHSQLTKFIRFSN